LQRIRGTQAAFLILFLAAAWAWIISPDIHGFASLSVALSSLSLLSSTILFFYSLHRLRNYSSLL
jgi:hypothetical protein